MEYKLNCVRSLLAPDYFVVFHFSDNSMQDNSISKKTLSKCMIVDISNSCSVCGV